MNIKTRILVTLSFILLIGGNINAQKYKDFPKELITEKANYYLTFYTMESLKTKKGTVLNINGMSLNVSKLKKLDPNEFSMQEQTLAKLLELVVDQFTTLGMVEPEKVYTSDVHQMQVVSTAISKADPKAPYTIVIYVGAFKKAEKKIKKGQDITLEDFTCSNFMANSTKKDNKEFYMVTGLNQMNEVFNTLTKDTNKIKK